MYFFVVFAGVCAGIFTGLLPGIHINLVASFVFVNIGFLLGKFDLKFVVLFILVMGVVHSFVDFIPSVIFGVPSSDNALSVLPAHRLVMQGEALRAIYLSAAGSLAGVFFAVFFMPVFYFFLEKFYEHIVVYVPYVLLVVMLLMILSENGMSKKFWAFIIVCFAGGLGCLVLNSRFSYMPLLTLFSGLFGISTLIFSIMFASKMLPKQNMKYKSKLSKGFWKASVLGSVASSVCLIVPGIGNSQAATIVALFFRKVTSELFIVVVGVINTFSFFMSLITFYLISRSRNGSMVVVSQILGNVDLQMIREFLFVMLIAGIIGYVVTMFLGRKILAVVCRININIVNISIITFILFVVVYLCGMFGFLVLLCSAFLGLLCICLDVRRVHLMSVLIIPVIINLL